MSEFLDELYKFIKSYVASNPGCTKDEILKATVTQFLLIKERSVFYRKEFAVRFSSAQGATFSNCILSLSTLRKYDHAPFIVCVVRPNVVELLLANSTFLKKSSPKGYNIDKVLKVLASGNSVFSFFFVGINLELRYVTTCLVSVLDKSILNATRVQFHWAGRSSRGVTQLAGNLNRVFDNDFSEMIDIQQAQEFLQRLIDLKPLAFEN